MNLLFADLDNTLIYSYKHDIGVKKRCVETCQGREISFITEKTYRLLQTVMKQMLLIPVTTRTVEQYSRIQLGIGNIRHALACNGGVLLTDGKTDEAWYRQSLNLVEESRQELEKAAFYLERDTGRTLEVRDIAKLFVFTKHRAAQNAVQYLRERLNPKLIDVFQNGEKIYAVPKNLNKGMALNRMKERLDIRDTVMAPGLQKAAVPAGKREKSAVIFAAGDSEFDIPLLEQADAAAVPGGGIGSLSLSQGICRMPGKAVFSEELLEFVLGNQVKS